MLNLGIPRRQPQSIGGNFHLSISIRTRCCDDGLQPSLLGRKGIEIRIGFGISRINGVELCLSLHHLAHSFFDHLPNGLSRVEHRFLRQVPDLDSGHRNCLALMILIDPRHDLEERRLPCTVQTEHADFGTGKEGERNIPKNLSLGRHHLAHAVHREDVLSHT